MKTSLSTTSKNTLVWWRSVCFALPPHCTWVSVLVSHSPSLSLRWELANSSLVFINSVDKERLRGIKCFPGSETQFVGNTITNNCSVVMSRQMTVDVVCSGSRKTVAYIDVASQDEGQMTMREWAEYFSSPHRPRVLNVLSLELTGTRCVCLGSQCLYVSSVQNLLLVTRRFWFKWLLFLYLQCFDAVGWAAGRASGL